jgi:GTP-binding protein
MKIRNIAIIAHVDHGKTTLVDELLKQSGTFRENQHVEVRVMDSNDLEKERGITILAKCTSVFYKDYKINIIDTPGHADFGGEVERILGMVEGVILLVDSQEGPMPQTRFVTSKALSLGLKPIVLVNKMDKDGRRPKEVIDEVLELFMNLEATDEQLDFPVLYAAARDGWVSKTEEKEKEDVSALFEMVVEKISEPKVDKNAKFAMVSTMIENDDYVGRMLTAKITSGTVKVGDSLKALDREGKLVEKSKVSKLMVYEGLAKKVVEFAEAGDIICLAGFTKATVSDTICDLEVETPLYAKPIDPPVISMTFSVNDSPLVGQDKASKKLTSRMIRERLLKEQEINVSIKVNDTENSDALEVSARGELQLAILIETMRREGFELSIGRPKVLIKEEDGVKMEPMEEVQVDVGEEFAGTIIKALQARKAIMTNLVIIGDKQRITFRAPTRALIGYYSDFLTETKGTGTMSRTFDSYDKWQGPIESRFNGVLISMENGKSAAYALFNLQDRGKMFIGATEEVYVGMVVGENAKDNDLEVNVVRGKQLTNMRASGKDDALKLVPHSGKSLEEAIAYIDEDEMIEVTPNFLRIRKKYLDPNERKKHSRKK